MFLNILCYFFQNFLILFSYLEGMGKYIKSTASCTNDMDSFIEGVDRCTENSSLLENTSSTGKALNSFEGEFLCFLEVFFVP